jgi:hypothetical protein
MSDPSFKPYQDAHDAYQAAYDVYQAAFETYDRDSKQLFEIFDRAVDSAKGLRSRRMKPASKLANLRTIVAQTGKLKESLRETKNTYTAAKDRFLAARDKYSAAIDAENTKWVNKFEALCSYAVGTGQGDAAIRYLLEECKAYGRVKGDYKLRRELYEGIVNLSVSACDAVEKSRGIGSSSEPEILNQLERISDPEESTAFYNKNRDEIHRGFEARQNNA